MQIIVKDAMLEAIIYQYHVIIIHNVLVQYFQTIITFLFAQVRNARVTRPFCFLTRVSYARLVKCGDSENSFSFASYLQ